MEALLDSGAYVIREKIRHEANQCIIREAPSPPFKVRYVNADFEQPLATYILRIRSSLETTHLKKHS